MANTDGTLRYGSGAVRTPTSPTFEQLLRASGDGSRWSGMNSPDYNREHEYPRKSVLTKVKDRARRWRLSLGKKKGVDQDNGTPSWGVSLEEDEFGEEDAVYLGAPMYESELAPEDSKENARQHPRANPVISEKHILPNSPSQEDPLHRNSCTSPNKTLAASRSGLNNDNASMMQGLTIRAPQVAAAGGRDVVSIARQNPVSPRVNNLDKGEDDRALSQVTTDVMSPRKSRANGNNPSNNVGIVEKVKDAVSSFLHAGESSSPSNAYPATRRATISNTPPEIVEEESHGKIPQAN